MTTSPSIFTDSFLTELLTIPENQTLTTPSSNSDQENSKRTGKVKNALAQPKSRKATKRRSRASKKTQTTYITADAANFRQMVQQVTGVSFNMHEYHQHIVKPEPQRFGGVSCLPTLDTSAFLIDHVVGPSSAGGGGGVMGWGTAVDGGGVVEFDGFPTLESSFSRVVESGFVTF